jgi:hypothetical protein
VLLADFFSGVRIGVERWNVLGGKAVTGAMRASLDCLFPVKSIFELFLIFLKKFWSATPQLRWPQGQVLDKTSAPSGLADCSTY